MSTAAVILDVDGTLVDSNDAHARAWVDAFAEAGIEVDAGRVRRAIGMGGDKLLPHVAAITEDSPLGASIAARRAEIFRTRYLSAIQPFPGVRQLVQRFAVDGFTIVVASSAKEDELHPLLERAGVADLIESRTSSDDADNSKPDPDIVAAALRRSGAAPEAAIMLGDTPYDVEAARGAGIAVVGLESGGWRRDELDGAIEVYSSAAELAGFYDDSLFARLKMERDIDAAIRRRRIEWGLMLLAVAGVTGLALLLMTRRAESGRAWYREGLEEDVPVVRRAGLGPRDRERLRRIIACTS